MKLIYSPDSHDKNLTNLIGGKGSTLFLLYSAGLPVPKPLCISTELYQDFVQSNEIGEQIAMAMNRKDLPDMRWEEIWDISLIIRNLFLRGVLPSGVVEQLKHEIQCHLGEVPLVVRSSSSTEDGASHSYAGMHSSLINISSAELGTALKKVWASLWSDRAILYRQELGLDAITSKMAVVVQPLVIGDVSGILFSKAPSDNSQMIVEAVYGLNQGLVDGEVEPDRWHVSRKEKNVLSHYCPQQRFAMTTASGKGTLLTKEVTQQQQHRAPLDETTLQALIDLALRVEKQLGSAIDMEWTLADGTFSLLQARPITTDSTTSDGDKRSWYLSLTRSYDNLKQLHETIAHSLLPAMQVDADRLESLQLDRLSNPDLATEITDRIALNTHYTSAYWRDCIPFAHGVRLFGEVYNDIIGPDNPFEFVQLLTGQAMLGKERNTLLWSCAQRVKTSSSWLAMLREGRLDQIEDKEIQETVSLLKKRFAVGFVESGSPGILLELLSAVILQFTELDSPPGNTQQAETVQLTAQFLQSAADKLPMEPLELLDLAKASYRLRDDDNIYLGRIGQEAERALAEARERLKARGCPGVEQLSDEELCTVLVGSSSGPKRPSLAPSSLKKPERSKDRIRFRQLQGQAASQGITTGKARVIHSSSDLKDFTQGEVLVIDSIDPTMTFFAPLAAAIIERRGGMLIHGAIIAREYGIPCITGVTDATSRIHTGDYVTVDGYLGICTVQQAKHGE